MRVINARIDDADDDGCRSCSDVPCGLRIDIRARNSSAVDVLTDILETPELRILRVVRRHECMHDVIRLNVFNVRIFIQSRDHGIGILRLRVHPIDRAGVRVRDALALIRINEMFESGNVV